MSEIVPIYVNSNKKKTRGISMQHQMKINHNKKYIQREIEREATIFFRNQ